MIGPAVPESLKGTAVDTMLGQPLEDLARAPLGEQ